jgi:ELWxxDGT repeat protein
LLALSVMLSAALAAPVAADTGPYLVKDINPSGDSDPSNLTALGSNLLFTAKGGGKGRELYISDGTPTGTHRVKDIRPGGASSNPDHLTAIGGLLYFDAHDGVHGRELWVSDGTGPGTMMLKDINGSGGSQPWGFTEFNGFVYFSADDGVTGRELWRTDGTGPGTNRFKDIEPGPGDSSPSNLISFAGQLFFLRTHCPTPACFSTLFKSNGTAAGTKPQRDNHGDKITGHITGLVPAGAFLYWTMEETELWRSRLGEASKTKSIGAIPAWDITAVGSLAFFTVFNGGNALWVSNGGAPGTQELANPGTVRHLVNVNNQLMFFDHEQLWFSDGTVAGTQPTNEYVTSGFGESAVIANVLYFDGVESEPTVLPTGVPPPDTTLWGATAQVNGAFNLGGPAYPRELTTVGLGVYYSAYTPADGWELWRYSPI